MPNDRSRKRRVEANEARRRSDHDDPDSNGTVRRQPNNNRPSLHSFGAYHNRKPGLPRDLVKETLVFRYKESTERFKNVIQSTVPPGMYRDSADTIMNSVQFIANHKLELEDSVFDDLKESISLRKKVAEHHDDFDPGHAYFIEVLEYCLKMLLPLKELHVEHAFCGMVYLIGDGDGYMTSDATRALRAHRARPKPPPMPRHEPPRRPTPPAHYSEEDLLFGSDRTKVILFLMTLDELMGDVILQFQRLKETSKLDQSQMFTPSMILDHMMNASLWANSAIQQVACLEQNFIEEHPHLCTVYRMLATVSLGDWIQPLTTLVRNESPIARHFKEKNAVAFLGDAMECAFRDPSDPCNRRDSLVSEFLEQWQIPQESSAEHGSALQDVQLIFDTVQEVAILEAPLHNEQKGGRYNGTTPAFKLSFQNIGANRSIVHTIRLLQNYSDKIRVHRGRYTSPKGFHGIPWADRPGPVTRTQIDMDDLLMGDIMPSLYNLCYEGMLPDNLPHQDELLSGFSIIRSFVQSPESPVSWSLACSVHTILVSVFELQGSKNLKYLAKRAQASFDRYIKQLERAGNMCPSAIRTTSPTWVNNMKSLQVLRWLVRVNIERTNAQMMLSLWNPYCAGCFLLYGTVIRRTLWSTPWDSYERHLSSGRSAEGTRSAQGGPHSIPRLGIRGWHGLQRDMGRTGPIGH